MATARSDCDGFILDGAGERGRFKLGGRTRSAHRLLLALRFRIGRIGLAAAERPYAGRVVGYREPASRDSRWAAGGRHLPWIRRPLLE